MIKNTNIVFPCPEEHDKDIFFVKTKVIQQVARVAIIQTTKNEKILRERFG